MRGRGRRECEVFLRDDRWLCIPLRAHGGARMTRRSEVCLALSSELECGQ